MTSYPLPNVEPFVRDVGQQVGNMFNVPTIGGWRASATDMTGHPAGLALDFQIGQDKAKGDKVAAYFLANYARLRVKYVLWQQKRWMPGQGGWKTMEYRSGDRPGYDPNHMRHVHVSFTSEATKGDSAGVLPAAGSSTLEKATADAEKYGQEADDSSWIRTAGDALDGALTNPFAVLVDGDTWKRVALVIGGGGLIVMGVVILVTSSKEVGGLVSTGLAAVPNPAAKAASVAVTAAQS